MIRLWNHAALAVVLAVSLASCADPYRYDRGYGYNTSDYRARIDDAYARGDISAEQAQRAERRADRVDATNERNYYRDRYGD